MPKLRSHSSTACSAVTSGSSCCRLSTWKRTAPAVTVSHQMCGMSTSSCYNKTSGAWRWLQDLHAEGPEASSLTRMKSLPRPWYLANSTVAAALMLAACRRPTCRVREVCDCLPFGDMCESNALCDPPPMAQSPAQRCRSMLTCCLQDCAMMPWPAARRSSAPACTEDPTGRVRESR
jgi:hypothetical protein